ncbi:MAG TPA: hypothetical protein ENI05_12235 [Porticoccus sp.]|nr:hypothetical protein [Porticoccus sp.]
MTTLREKRLQKRFTGFLWSSGLIFVGLFFAKPEIYPIFSMMISGAYAAYLGGQSWTDWQKAKNGNNA